MDATVNWPRSRSGYGRGLGYGLASAWLRTGRGLGTDTDIVATMARTDLSSKTWTGKAEFLVNV